MCSADLSRVSPQYCFRDREVILTDGSAFRGNVAEKNARPAWQPEGSGNSIYRETKQEDGKVRPPPPALHVKPQWGMEITHPSPPTQAS